MNVFNMSISFIVGLLLGLFFFGALWLTVRQIPNSRHPGLLLFISFLGRMGLILFAFYLIVKDGQWQNLLICLTGFILMRLVLLRRWGSKGDNSKTD